MRYSANEALLLQRTSRKDVAKGILTLAKADGMFIEDVDGRKYMDLTSGNTRPVSLGYGCEAVAKACYEQIMSLSYATPCGVANVTAMRLAERIAALAPEGVNHIVFECSGSEAVESALKLARQYHAANGNRAKYKTISRIGAYHGVNGGGLSALGVVLPMRHSFEPGVPGAVFIPSPYCYRCPFGKSRGSCDLHCVAVLEEAIMFEDPGLVSAFIGETVQQGFGVCIPPDGYWDGVRALCDKYEVVLIEDEVICGFGRTGKMFAAEHFGLKPDLMTMAKCMTSGYVPLSGVGISDKIFDSLDSFMHLHTYGNHPVGCAAGMATLDMLEEHRLVERSEAMGVYFLDALRDALADSPSVGEVRGLGLWLAVDMTPDKKTRSLIPASSLNNIIAMALERGFVIRSMGSAIELAPPFIITREDIDAFVPVFRECVHQEERALGLRK